MKIQYKGKVLEAEPYGKEDYLLKDGTIINEMECIVIENDSYKDLRNELASNIYAKLVTSSIMMSTVNLEAMAENAILYANIFTSKLKEYDME